MCDPNSRTTVAQKASLLKAAKVGQAAEVDLALAPQGLVQIFPLASAQRSSLWTGTRK